MNKLKYLAALLVLSCLGADPADAQTNKTTNCWTESGQWYLDFAN